MMATVPHLTSGLGLRKFQADGFLLTRVYTMKLHKSLFQYLLQAKEKANRLPPSKL